MQRPPRHHQHLAVVRHLEHHVVVEDVQRVVQRVHGQRRRPVQLDLKIEGNFTSAPQGVQTRTFLVSTCETVDRAGQKGSEEPETIPSNYE